MKCQTLILLAALLLCGVGCDQRGKVQSLPQTDYVYFHADNFYKSSAFEMTQTYLVGMSREKVREILGEKQLVSSLSRPEAGWRFLAKDKSDIGSEADEFESKHPNVRVVACDVYHATGGWHILFFDRSGFLVGFRRGADGILWYSSLFQSHDAA